jgi:hypothetical protein
MKNSEIIDVIIGAIIGGIIQVVATYALAVLAQLTAQIALIVAFPMAFVAFLGVWFLLTRVRVEPSTDSSRQAIKPPPAYPIKSPPEEETQPIKIDKELTEVLGEFGIVKGASRLSQSKYEPMECMRAAQRKLHFMGILGSKWVTESHVRAEFNQFLERIQTMKGSVRFLLINPYCEAFSSLRTLRGGAISADSLRAFQELQKRFTCLEVKLYSEIPCFRLVFIDGNIVAVSRYRIDKERYLQSRFGWEAPHLIIQSSSIWSLYEAFELYYLQAWDRAQDLEKILQSKGDLK